MTIVYTPWYEVYYNDAKEFILNNYYAEYMYDSSELGQVFMVRDYTKWLYQIDHVIRIWE
jgi:hypothetical protein